jgi:hypothetical protein
MILCFGTSSRVKVIEAVFRLDKSALGSVLGLLHNERLFLFNIVERTWKCFSASARERTSPG